jgi:hypothetical protein
MNNLAIRVKVANSWLTVSRTFNITRVFTSILELLNYLGALIRESGMLDQFSDGETPIITATIVDERGKTLSEARAVPL